MEAENSKQKVLFVDDNQMDRLILSKILDELELEYEETKSAEEFLPKIKEYAPDLCLVDLNLKRNNDGTVLIKAIRNILGENLPIIIISAIEDSKEIADNLKNGANDFICKPIDKALLSSKISNYLTTQTIKSRILPLFIVPDNEDSQLELDYNISIMALTESGIEFTCEFDINPGITIQIQNSLFKEIFPKNDLLSIKITNKEDNIYTGSFLGLTEDDIHRIRKIITSKRG